MADTIYLDYAAATPLDPTVLAAMQPYFAANFYNPSATYSAGRGAHEALESARQRVAYWLGARPSEIVFTAGGTEANNLAIHGIMRQFPGSNTVVSAIEHDSVLAPASHYEVRQASVAPDGRVDERSLEDLIDEQTVLISIMYANNEIGTIQPIRQVAQLIDKIRRERLRKGNKLPLYLHTDACQAANYLDLHVARLGVDLMTLNGGKIYGPKQSGLLYIKAGVVMQPLIDGGGQERGLRSGTENLAAIVGLAESLDLTQNRRDEEVQRLGEIQQATLQSIGEKLPLTTINGSLKQRLPNNLHITLPDTDNERVLIQLDEAGVMAAAGSACSASNEEPSHVLRAIGLTDVEAQSSLRFTMGRQTKKDELDRLIDLLVQFSRKPS